MAEKGEEGDQPKIKPSLGETLASAEGANELNQSGKRGQSLKSNAKWNGRGASSGQKEAGPLSQNRSSWRCRAETNPDNERSSHSLAKDDLSKGGVKEPRDQSRRSPAPKQGRTGWDLERRSRGRDSSHSPDYKQKRTGKRGRTNSPCRWQKRREKREPSYSPIKNRMSGRSPGLHRRSPHGSPFQMPVSDGTISSTSPSAVPKERFSNAADDAAMKHKMSTSCSRQTDTINPVGPTSEAPKLGQPQSNKNGTTVEVLQSRHSFKRALAGFAKANLRPFWLTRQLKDYVYWHVRHQFVSNVTRNLERRFPHIHTVENIFKFDKENNHSLSGLLKWYLRRFLSEDIIKRYFVPKKVSE